MEEGIQLTIGGLRHQRRVAALAQGQKPSGLDDYFTNIVQQFRPYLRAVVFSIIGNQDDVEDIVSEALYKAYINLHGFTLEEREQLNARAWLAEITRNLCYDAQKREKPVSLESLLEAGYSPLAHPYSNPEDRALYVDAMATLSDCVNSLSPHERVAIARCLINGEAACDVAKSLGMSRSALYVCTHRALRKLRHPKYTRRLVVQGVGFWPMFLLPVRQGNGLPDRLVPMSSLSIEF
jgi:RNA polymerase sigma factor (sigma-70 family)